jgi:hypothetical protein
VFFAGEGAGVSSIEKFGGILVFESIKSVISLDIEKSFEYFFVFEHSLGVEVFGVFVFDSIEADLGIRGCVVDL